jgi:hypothetical protein
MDAEQARTLVAEIGKRLEIPDMELDEVGTCALAVDGGAVTLTLVHDEETGALDIGAMLSELELTPARLARALAANFCWAPAGGAAFGLDDFSDTLVLQHRVEGESDADTLIPVLEGLVNHASAWAKLLAEVTEEEKPTQAATMRPEIGGMRAGGGAVQQARA